MDRMLRESIDWMEPEVLAELREWRGQTRGESYLPWKEVHTRAKAANIRINGHFNGEPGAHDAFVARRALALLRGYGDAPIHAVVLVRDSDNDEAQRRKGLEQARAEVSSLGPILIGIAHTKRECWVLAGFTPETDDEKARHQELRQELGFDPCLRAEELTAQQDGAKRDAKRVLKLLTHGVVDREHLSMMQATIQQLEERGRGTGLSTFLSEVREKLVPLWTGAPPPRPKHK
ncbi:hypothetical protein K8640_37345 [Myxococcus sp. XM-1-1-1]|uniref:hypothetical protein n=1 Tax=Myxococcus sp. XM-1-1-1 TaxID=2874602 RepID=UPI001CBC2E1D|nr:hypothetical protein [Myxococcus sp. XM-1-1-1]MBZ4413904.1 hypothetical protein [Myxococcus sp. XM-1-1-1]